MLRFVTGATRHLHMHLVEFLSDLCVSSSQPVVKPDRQIRPICCVIRVSHLVSPSRIYWNRSSIVRGLCPLRMIVWPLALLIEMTVDEDVWIDILAFSRPNTALARIGNPLMRLAQSRFGKESVDRMQSAVDRGSGLLRGKASTGNSRSDRRQVQCSI